MTKSTVYVNEEIITKYSRKFNKGGITEHIVTYENKKVVQKTKRTTRHAVLNTNTKRNTYNNQD